MERTETWFSSDSDPPVPAPIVRCFWRTDSFVVDNNWLNSGFLRLCCFCAMESKRSPTGAKLAPRLARIQSYRLFGTRLPPDDGHGRLRLRELLMEIMDGTGCLHNLSVVESLAWWGAELLRRWAIANLPSPTPLLDSPYTRAMQQAEVAAMFTLWCRILLPTNAIVPILCPFCAPPGLVSQHSQGLEQKKGESPPPPSNVDQLGPKA